MSWDPVPVIDQNGVITQYEVEYNQTRFSAVKLYNNITVDSTTLMVNLTGLEEDLEYFIRVRAYTSVGAGPYSVVVMERTLEYCMHIWSIILAGKLLFLLLFFSSRCSSGQCNCCKDFSNCNSSVLGKCPSHCSEW